ncbi:MAG: PqqD family protein [Candidatus Omnitrophota bacterium]
MNPKLYPAKPQDLRWIEKQGFLIILTPKNGLYHKLNKVASLVWLHSNGTRTIEEIVKLILLGYRVRQARLEKDIHSLLNYLKSKRLINFFKSSERFYPVINGKRI